MSVRSMLSRNAQLAVSGLIAVLCKVYAAVLPRRYWYRASLLASRLLSATFGKFVSNKWNIGRSSQTARLLHRFLDRLASSQHVPMPITMEGEDLLQRFFAEPGGFLCCTAHLPLANLLGRHLHDASQGIHPIRIVSAFPNAQNAIESWNGKPVEAIFLDANVLLHVRRALKRNTCVIVLLDTEQGQPVSPKLFRFAARCNAKSLAYFPQLLPDGRIASRFLALPYEICADEEQIAANVRFFEDHIDNILGGGRHALQAHTLRYPSVLENHHWVDELPSRSDEQLRAQREQILQCLADNRYKPRDRFLYMERVKILNLELSARASDASEQVVPG